jgi:hypothetical protein
VNGAQEFLVRWEVKNASASAPLHLKAMVAADFYFDGSDRGTGIFTEGPPRFIGGTNADTGNSGGFIKVLSTSPPWSHYQALEFGGAAHQVWGKIAASASSTDPSFDDTVIGDQVDNAGAEITGVNPGTGSVTLGPDGRAVITDPGAVAGDDTIVDFRRLQQRWAARAGRAAGVCARHLCGQRVAALHRARHGRPPGRRRRGQAARDHG